MKRPSQTMINGAIAGLVGATILAAWFLIIDLVRASPFATPAFVARTLLGAPDMEPTLTLLAMYTALHFSVFVVVGAVVAWAFERSHLHAYVVLGLVLGFLLFDLIFYAGVLITGVNVVRELGWPQVLAGNLFAGLALVGYLNVTGPDEPVRLRDVLRQHRTIREGLVAGIAGAVAVMAWFLALDLIQSRLMFTPGALGSAIFFGARGELEVVVAVETVLGYTGVHIAAFMLAGLLASALTEAARREPPLLLGLVLFFVTLEVLFIGLIAIMASWLLDALSWWTIVAGNLIAAAVMGGYLLYEHPELREHLTHDLEEEMV